MPSWLQWMEIFQHPPYLIPLLEAYNEGYDIVSGQRTRKGSPLLEVPLHASSISCQTVQWTLS